MLVSEISDANYLLSPLDYIKNHCLYILQIISKKYKKKTGMWWLMVRLWTNFVRYLWLKHTCGFAFLL